MNKPLTTTPHHPAAEGGLAHRRKAIAALGHELRLLVDATVRTAASPETLNHLADGVRALTGQLTGPGSPLAPPMHVTPVDGGVTGRCLLGIAR
ncbi:hypothetical protein ABTX77_30315 [Streptomyces sp. NPDC097704]|uniref:hypothetical protein n=1 Tax=Streptomyces sp. NPDC097704 TaxID=3157101 RepID=UPI00332780C3